MEQVVVAGGELFEYLRQCAALAVVQVGDAADVAFGQQQGFKRPCGPVGDDGQPVVVFGHDALAAGGFFFSVVLQQGAAVFGEIAALGGIGFGGQVGQEVARPDLAVGVGVGAAHDCAFVFKYLHPAVGLPQFFCLLLPNTDDGFDLFGRQFRQGFAVVGREADDAADSAHALALEQGVAVVGIGGSVGQQGGEVIGEDKGFGVIGVLLAGDAFVARAKVARRVVRGFGGGVGRFLLSLPRAFGAVGGDEYPLVGKGVVAAVGVVCGMEHGCIFCVEVGVMV